MRFIVATLTYERDVDFLFRKDGWFTQFKHNHLTKKIVLVNNVSSKKEILDKFDRFDDTNFVFVGDYIEEVKEKFGLSNKTSTELWYLIPYFVLLIYCEKNYKDSYVLFCAPDCLPTFSEKFITDSVDELSNNPNIILTTLSTVETTNTGEGEAGLNMQCLGVDPKSNKFHLGLLMHDGFWFSSVKNLLNIDYFTSRPNPYGRIVDFVPGVWEEKVCWYFHNAKKFRGIYKGEGEFYIHLTEKSTYLDFKEI